MANQQAKETVLQFGPETALTRWFVTQGATPNRRWMAAASARTQLSERNQPSGPIPTEPLIVQNAPSTRHCSRTTPLISAHRLSMRDIKPPPPTIFPGDLHLPTRHDDIRLPRPSTRLSSSTHPSHPAYPPISDVHQARLSWARAWAELGWARARYTEAHTTLHIC